MKEHNSKHHRRPRSKEGNDAPKNISFVSEAKHRAWHLLFINWEPEEIALEINRTWLDPDFIFVVKRRDE